MKPNESGAEVRCPKCKTSRHVAVSLIGWCAQCASEFTPDRAPEPASEAVKGKAAWLDDAPPGKAWKCPDCLYWATLGGNAGFHRDKEKHGEPILIDQPAAPESTVASLQAQVEQLKRERDEWYGQCNSIILERDQLRADVLRLEKAGEAWRLVAKGKEGAYVEMEKRLQQIKELAELIIRQSGLNVSADTAREIARLAT